MVHLKKGWVQLIVVAVPRKQTNRDGCRGFKALSS